jgi:hypothetical protein
MAAPWHLLVTGSRSAARLGHRMPRCHSDCCLASHLKSDRRSFAAIHYPRGLTTEWRAGIGITALPYSIVQSDPWFVAA